MSEQTERKDVKIKICGLFRQQDIEYVNEARPDFCGFIIDVPRSHRNVTPDQVRALRQNLNPGIVPVGVFCNAPVELVASLLLDGTIEMAQLHGSEDETYIRKLKSKGSFKIVKAFNEHSLQYADASSADLILLDHGSGGTGESFDWMMTQQISRPFFLAGGLGPDNLAEVIEKVRPWGVDLSSKVETDGKKDREKILSAVDIVRNME